MVQIILVNYPIENRKQLHFHFLDESDSKRFTSAWLELTLEIYN